MPLFPPRRTSPKAHQSQNTAIPFWRATRTSSLSAVLHTPPGLRGIYGSSSSDMHQLWHPDITQHGTASSGTSTLPSEFTNQIRAAYANSHFNSRRVARRQTRASNAVLVFAESRNEHDMGTIEARKHNVITTVTRDDRNVHMVQRIARYGSPSSAFTRR